MHRPVAVVLAVLTAVTALVGGLGAATAAPAGAALPACTRSWTGGSGSWTDAAKWSGGVVPTAQDHVCIATGPGTVAVRGIEVTVASLRLGTGTATPAVALTLVPEALGLTASLTATQGIEVAVGGELVLGGGSSGATAGGTARVVVGDGANIANAGTIRSVVGSGGHSAVIEGTVVNAGLFAVGYELTLFGALDNLGTLQVAGTDLVLERLIGRDGRLVGTGSVQARRIDIIAMESGTDDPLDAPVLYTYDGTIVLSGDARTNIQAQGRSTLAGAVRPGQQITVIGLGDAASTLAFTGTLVNQGRIVLQPSAGWSAALGGSNSVAVTNDGSIEVRSTGEAPGRILADVVNRGLVTVAAPSAEIVGDLRNEGEIDLREGFLRVEDGDADLTAGGLLSLDADFDREVSGLIDVDGLVTVDGPLLVRTGTPSPVGSTFTVVNGNSRAGTFAELLFTGPASYDAIYNASQVNLVRRASESATRRFVRAAFQDFLDRQPNPTELASRAAAIDGGTLTRATLVRQLSTSPEYVTTLVQRFYTDTLGRPGEPDGVTFWVGELRSGRRTVAEVAGSFYASQEYVTRAGGTLPTWITDLYDVFFERPPSDADLDYWIARTLARGRTRVAIELFQSLESRRQRVDRLYRDLLGREGEAGGVDYWAARLTREGDLVLAVFLASSGEYLARAQTRYP